MAVKWSTTISYIALCGISVHSAVCYFHNYSIGIPLASFGILAANSLLGAWCTGNKERKPETDEYFKKLDYFKDITALALIDVHIGRLYRASILHPITHGVLIAYPLIQYYKEEEINASTRNTVIGVNAASLGILSFFQFNVMGMAATGVYVLNHFFMELQQEFIDYPRDDIFNFGMCAYVFMLSKAIEDAHTN